MNCPICKTCNIDEPLQEHFNLCIATLQAQNTALLEALELLTEMTDDPIRYMGCRSARLDIARAALAKAKDGVA